MHKRVIILAILALGSGMGSAFAQNIFLKPDSNAPASNEGPVLFLKPQGSQLGKATQKQINETKVAEEIKLENRYLQKIVNQKIGFYNEWNRSGFKPSTGEEIVAYADSSRARQQAQNYKEREKIYAQLEKQQLRIKQQADAMKAQAKKNAVKTHNALLVSSNASAKAASENAVVSKGSAKPKAKAIYTKPESYSKPTKVFSDY